MKAFRFVVFGFLMLSSLADVGHTDAALKARIEAAKSGTTVKLPAGIVKLGDISIPVGVSLQGAGYNLTTIDATGFRNGLVIQGGRGATISDFTVRGAR